MGKQENFSYTAWIILVLIFVIDLLVPLGVAMGTLYILSFFLIIKLIHQKRIILLASIASTLVLVAFFIAMDSSTNWMVYANRTISVTAIWVMVYFTIGYQRLTSQLKDTKKGLGELLNAAPDAMILVNQDGLITYANNQCLNIFQYQPSELNNGLVNKLLPDNLAENHANHIISYFKDPKARAMGRGLKLSAKRKDGSLIPVEISLSPTTIDGKTLAIAAIRDMTYRETIENELRDSREKYKSLYDNSPVMMHSLDPHGKIIRVNNFWLKTMGYTREEVIGKKATDFLCDDIKEVVINTMGKDLENDGFVNNAECSLVKKNGETIKVLLSAVVIRNQDGENLKSLAFLTDITAKKQLELERERFEQNLQLAQEIAGIGYYITDTNSGKTSISQGFRNIFGIEVEEFSTEDLYRLIHTDDYDMVISEFENCIRKKKNFYIEYRSITPANIEKTVKCHGYFLFNDDDTVQKVFGVVLDISQQVKQEKQLVSLIREVESSNKELEQFAYIASHDLQEPLRTLTSYINLLKSRYSDNLDDKALKYMAFCTNAAERMRQLIKDLLNFSRLGREELKSEWTDLNEVITTVRQDLKRTIRENQAEIVSDHLPSVKMQGSHANQLFQNLISNAIKFKNDNSVPKIMIRTIEAKGKWKVSVEDNGIGIEKEYQEHIFMPFKRLHSRKHYTGSGIGLAACKKIMELYGGNIEVKSEIGKGSQFYLSFPKANRTSPENT